MRTQDIVIGKSYRHKDNPNYCFAKVLERLNPGQYPNTHTYTIFKCAWSERLDGDFALIKYFRASDLIFRMVKSMNRKFTDEEGKQILEYWEKHSTMSIDEIIEHFEKVFNMQITQIGIANVIVRHKLGEI